MSGLSSYTSQNLLNALSGNVAFPGLSSVYCALFTGAGLDDGTSFIEVSGTGYVRVQVAGAQTVNGTTAAGNNVLHFGTVGGWITTGMQVRDATGSGALPTVPAPPTVTAVTATTVTLSANAQGAGVGATDSIVFSAFGIVSGTGPSQIQNISTITFAQATGTAGWGTVIAFGLTDQLSGTVGQASVNLLGWDYLGNFSWLPFTVSSASPGVLTAKAHGYSAADPLIVSQEYGGTAPTFSQSNFTGVLQVVSPAADTFTVTNAGTAVNTSSTGSGMVRKIVQQSIPQNVTASFAAAQLTVTAA